MKFKLDISQWSITSKLSAVIILTMIISQIVSIFGLIIYEATDYPNEIKNQLTTLAKITGIDCRAALSYNDPETAQKCLNSLSENPDLLCAAIYDRSGVLFASCKAPGARPSWPSVGATHLFSFPERIEHGPTSVSTQMAIMDGKDGDFIGSVYVELRQAAVEHTLRSYMPIELILSAIGLLVSFLISLRLQKFISQPILNLAEVARQVTMHKDYSLRVGHQTQDELGILINAFNRMLEEIFNREQELQAANLKLAGYNAGLEQEVQRRVFDLRAKTEEAENARRMAERANRAKSDFLAQMSHELRTPLNGILGYAQILKKEQNLGQSQLDGIRVIERSGEHLLALINDILDLSKIESRRLEVVCEDFSLRNLLSDIGVMIQLRAESNGLEFKVEVEEALPMVVHGDQKRIRQVLINLLGNAVKFTERGEIRLRVTSRAEKIRFEIIDTGVGIAQEKIDQIFLPFHQVGDTRKFIEGTGLGLAISRRLVELMGGRLEVESQVGKGSVFSFEISLPEVHLLSLMHTGFNQRIIGYEGERKRILVVDDLVENREIIRKMVEPLGFDILEVSGGAGCLAKLQSEPVDLVILDLMMPELDGYETTKLLRQQGSQVPVIAISASVYIDNQKRSVLVGCNDFLTKPIRYEDLMGILQKHLKIKWLYQVDDSFGFAESSFRAAGLQSLIIPPIEECREILELVQRGDVKLIYERVEGLEARDTNYAAFVGQIRQLLSSFKLDEIDKYIQQAIKATL